MKRLLLAEQWDEFARLCMPASASAVQRRDMRRVFFAGAYAIMRGIIAPAKPKRTAEEVGRMADSVIEELQDFAEAEKWEGFDAYAAVSGRNRPV